MGIFGFINKKIDKAIDNEKKKIVCYYRGLVCPIMGTPSIDGIDRLSDDMIFKIHNEVTDLVHNIAHQKAKKAGKLYELDNYIVQNVVRTLEAAVNGGYEGNLQAIRIQAMLISW